MYRIRSTVFGSNVCIYVNTFEPNIHLQSFLFCLFLLLADNLKTFNIIINVSESSELQRCLDHFHRWYIYTIVEIRCHPVYTNKSEEQNDS